VKKFHKNNKGISLLEVIVVMVIAGILSAVAIPSFITAIRNNRITAHTNDLTTGLMLARTEAIKRNTPVVMCRSSKAPTATTAADCASGSGNGGWENGWFIYTDTTNPVVLMRRGAYTGAVTITGSNNLANRVGYNPQGLTGMGGYGSLTLSDGRAAPQGVRIICVTVTGRPRLAVAATDAASCSNI
jgi:type IV fimbrial biogenesis protein FimT